MFHVAARLFAMSRCAYGWISRLPTQAVCKKLWAELRLGQQTLKAASPYLRCVLTGGLSHLDCIAAVNLIRIVHFMKHGSQINWQAGRGSPLAVLKQWLKDKGWAIVQPGGWAVQNSFFRLDLVQVTIMCHICNTNFAWVGDGSIMAFSLTRNVMIIMSSMVLLRISLLGILMA